MNSSMDAEYIFDFDKVESVFDDMKCDIKNGISINPVLYDSCEMTRYLLSLVEESMKELFLAEKCIEEVRNSSDEKARAIRKKVGNPHHVAYLCRDKLRAAKISLLYSLQDLKYLIDWNKKTIICPNHWGSICHYCKKNRCHRHKTIEINLYNISCDECESCENDSLCSSCRFNEHKVPNLISSSIVESIVEFFKSRKIELNWGRRFPFAAVLCSIKDEESLTPLMKVFQCYDTARLIGSFL